MSANLIGFGADLQQKLDAMNPRLRRSRWAGDVGHALFEIAQALHDLDVKAHDGKATQADRDRERRLRKRAREQAHRLGKGIEVHRRRDPRGWPLYVLFPGDVHPGEGPEAIFEQAVAVPPRP